MIKKIEDLNYYELLEVSTDATTQEIHKAYERIRRIYDPNSIALYSLFTPEETAFIHQRVEEAYRTLLYDDNRKRYDDMLFRESFCERDDLPAPDFPSGLEAPTMTQEPERSPGVRLSAPAEEQVMEKQTMPEPDPAPVDITEFSGAAMRMAREQRGLSLRNISDITKIGMRYLEFIEEENFDKLPARTYIRGFVALYAKALGCDSEQASSDYVKRYDASRPQKTK